MSKDNGGPAFPSENPAEFVSGMSLRDYMAINASDGDVDKIMFDNFHHTLTRQQARYMHADFMLAERDK